MDLSKYRQLYVSETQENLDKLSGLLVELEAAPSRAGHIDSVFRLFHSIKGMSGTMGYTPMADLAHLLEDLMSEVRAGNRGLDANGFDLLLAGVDRMVRWVADVDAERLPLQSDDEARDLARRVQHALMATAPPPMEPVTKPLRIQASLDPECQDPGVRGFLLYRKLRGLGTVVASKPAEDVLRSGQHSGSIEIVLQTDHPPDRVRTFVDLLPEWTDVGVTLGTQAPPEPEPELELVLDFDDDPPEPAEPPQDTLPPEQTATAAIVRPASRATRTIRVRTEWLDQLLDRVGDLLIVSQRLWSLNQQSASPTMTDGLSELARLLGGLRSDAMSVRMTPVSVLTSRLPRVVRDLARKVGKQATLEVQGEEQQLDRAIIEGLDAPLTHMVTNAIEHGIETPGERAAAGKPTGGTLTLSCERVRDEIVVTLADDGAGVDTARLVDAAVATGRLGRERAESLAQRDLVRLVGMPGITARAEAGVHAGRGVGMDAVVESVVALGGRVEMSTRRGEGTTVRLRLPRTPGISRLLLVEADAQVFGLPLGGIVRTGVFGPEDIERDRGAEYVSHGDERYRLHRLRHLLGLQAAPPDARFPGVVFSRGEHPFVVGVDRVVGQQDAVIKPLGALLERIEGLHGVTIDTVGHPVFVVDVTRFAVVS